jgi:hypothetical protein
MSETTPLPITTLTESSAPRKNSTRGRGTTVVSISLNDVELERLAAHCRATGLGRSGTIAALLFRSTPRPRKRAK